MLDEAEFDKKWYWVEEVLTWPELADVKAELEDVTRFKTHVHGRRYGYRLGCRGPLCTKANRDDIRQYKRNRHAYSVEKPRTLPYDELYGMLNKWCVEKNEIRKQKKESRVA